MPGGKPTTGPEHGTSGDERNDMQSKKRVRDAAKRDFGGEAGRVVSLAVLFLSIAAGCSEEGGDDDDGGDFKSVPSTVTFNMGTGGVPLEIEFAGGDVSVDALLSGFYDINPDEWGVGTASTFSIDTGTFFGALEVTVIDRLLGTAWDVPRSGTIQILHVDSGDLITVGVVTGGVEIFYDDLGDAQNVLGPFAYSWEELYELFGTSPAEYEEIASVAWAVIELARERFLVVFQVFVAIFEQGEFLEAIGPEMRVEVPDGCQDLPGSGTFGDGIYTWHDDNLNGLVDTGDSFSVEIEDCWVDSPGSIDSLFDGMIELTGFFCSEVPFSTGANIEYQDFQERVTEEVGGVFSIVPGADTITRGDSSVAFD